MDKAQGYLLIAEDDPDIRKLLDTTLTFKGHRVVATHNGRDALESIQKERPLIVITDIMMPQLDGFGLVHRLRIDPETRNIPVVFITATYVSRADQEFALNIGATRFIQKPVDLDRFLATVQELLELGTLPAVEPLKEFNFYDGYRKRLQAKLDQKVQQIAREEHLLSTRPDEANQAILASLHQAIYERDEIKLLLAEVHKQLSKYEKTQ
jgi:CheY-like chemotaxis protein